MSVKPLSIVLMCVSALLVPALAAAQKIQIGVQGGVSLSTLANLSNAVNFNGPVDVKRRVGGAIGSFVVFPMNESVAVQVEGLIVTKGAAPTDGTNELKIRLAYIDVPVLLRVSRPSMRGFYFLAGPSFNVNVSAKTVDIAPAETEEDIADDIRNAEFGLVFGAGVTRMNVLLEACYSAGLTDIASSSRILGVEITAPVRNRVIAILVGVGF